MKSQKKKRCRFRQELDWQVKGSNNIEESLKYQKIVYNLVVICAHELPLGHKSKVNPNQTFR